MVERLKLAAVETENQPKCFGGWIISGKQYLLLLIAYLGIPFGILL